MADRGRTQTGDDFFSETAQCFAHRHPSIHNKQPRALYGVRTMRLGAVGDLIAHSRRQRERAAIGKIGPEFAIDAEEDVTLLAPVISQITRRIFYEPHQDDAEL